MANRTNKYINRKRELEVEKEPWLEHFQSLAEIFLTRKSDFTHTHSPGEFLQDEVFDNTPQFAAQLMASVFLSMLWPDSARTFNLKPVKKLQDVSGVEAYFKFVTEEMHMTMDTPRAGLQLALMEHFTDQGIFGTSGIGTFEGPEDDDESLPVVYEAWDVKNMFISQNAQGFVDTIYFKIMKTIRQMVEEYGEAPDKISSKVMELFNNGKLEDKLEVLIVIEPKKAQRNKRGVAGMPVRTVHIDIQHKFIMREGGFEEMPVAVARFFKRIDETYGRSPGMTALPDAASLNALSEAVLVASEKQLDPPLGLLDDGRLGGGIVDTSAGALNVFNASGRIMGEKPIFPLFTVGELQSAEKLQINLTNKIMQAFFLDRLLDLNNQVQMTAFEASIRNKLRGESMGSIFARQEMEVLTPTILRTFNIKWRRGDFGVGRRGEGAKARRRFERILGQPEVIVPEAIIAAARAGLDIFEIEYISPAKRFMKAEKLQGIFTATDALVALNQVIPGIADAMDPDETARQIWQLAGAPREALRTKDEIAEVRENMGNRLQAADALSVAKEVATIGQTTAQAQATRGQGRNGGGK